MSEEDNELERLKAKRLAEMEKNISFQKQTEESSQKKESKPPNKRDVVIEKLGYRGLEVLKQAESQFPNETNLVVEKLSELISTGELNETILGGQLLYLFRTVGLNIRMPTKINVEQDGKFVSLSEKLASKKPDNTNSS